MKKIFNYLLITLTALALGVSCANEYEWTETNKEVIVTFDSQGGSAVEPQTILAGEFIEMPANPTKDGAVFAGWYDAIEDGSKFSFYLTTAAFDCTLYAYWTEKYTVTFDADNDTEDMVLAVGYGETVSAPTAPVLAGYDFIDWYLDGDINNGAFDFTTAITENITLKAIYEEQSPYVVATFVQNFFGTTESVDVDVFRYESLDQTADVDTQIAPLMVDGCAVQWYEDAECTALFNTSTKLSAKITLYGSWRMQDGDGNTYPIVNVSGTYWMAQNIRSTSYADGTPMTVTNDKTTLSTATNMIDVPFAAHIMDVDTEVETDAVVVARTEKWGMLYNWYAIGGTHGSICPTGWHLPSYDEYVALYTATSDYGSKATKHLASNEADSWVVTESAPTISVNSPLEDIASNNSTGFNLYGSPAILDGGNFGASSITEATGNLDYKAEANLWTSTEKDASSTGVIQVQGCRVRGNLNYYSWFGRPKQYMLSVRCMKD